MTALAHSPSRRAVLAGAGALVIGAYLPKAAKARQGDPLFAPNAFVRIAADSTVTVLVKHIEVGQGPFTGLATLVAEELDADWSQMRAEHAPADVELYANLVFGHLQVTGGSTAMANSWVQIRQAAAAARVMLLQAAAAAWKVPAVEIGIERGVLQDPSGRRGSFGDFAGEAAKLPLPKNVQLKPAAAYRLIGREGAVKRLDSAIKSTGRARFTIDIREPNMLTVVVARPPRFGGKLVSFDATQALKIRGVVDVKSIGSGVAVYAEGMWPALKGREALKVSWDDSAAETRSSPDIVAHYRELARSKGAVAGSHGDAATALAGAERVIEAEYTFPYLAHAPMEPLDGYLAWNGEQALARFGSQFQTPEHQMIADVLGLPLERVSIETMIAGGSFGRRAQHSQHLAAELAMVAKAIGPNRPVKVVWTREDDLGGGYYRPIYVHRLRGALKDGRISAWSNTIVGQSINIGTIFEFSAVKNGVDSSSVEGASGLLYDMPNFACEVHTPKVGVPTLWWRSVGHTHTGYAVECFIDQLLQEVGQDPVAGRLALMTRRPRAAGALKAVAELAGWDGPGPNNGRARGVAVVESFGSYVAQIAEVSFEDEPRVHKVWCAVDCGIAINPDIVRAQMEGGIGFGLGHVLYGEITLDRGRPVQSNFDSYRSLRINEMPAVEVRIVPSAEAPSGVGEPGVPPIGPAVANALARLGRERPSSLPMVKGAG